MSSLRLQNTVIINISKFESHVKNDYETLILNPRWIKRWIKLNICIFKIPSKNCAGPYQTNPTNSSTTSSLMHVAECSIIQTFTQIIVYS